MKVFKYLSCKRGIAETYEIYKVVQELKPYAVTKYKGKWEEALEESFFHILDNYNSSKGELKHYAIRVVGTIYLTSNTKVLVNTEQADLCMDLNTAKDYAISSVVVDEKGTDFDKCLVEMVNLLVDDFKFFASFFTKDRKGDYSKLFAKYSADTIKSVQEYLVDTYKEDLARLFNFSKNTSIKDFKEDRYLGSLDKGLTFNGIINDIVVIKRERGYHCKKIFKINLGEVISDIVRLFYTDTCFGKSLIENVPVYVSLSGKIVHDKDELMNLLERELVGSLLSRTPLKVVNYIKGNELLLSSTKDTQHDVQLPMFGKDFVISFERMAVKEVF